MDNKNISRYIVGLLVVFSVLLVVLFYRAEKTMEVESVGWVNTDGSVECRYSLPIGLGEAFGKTGRSPDYYGQILMGWVPNEIVKKKVLGLQQSGHLVWIEVPEPGRPRAWIIIKRGNEKLPEFIREK